MHKGIEITIRKVGNGFEVTPYRPQSTYCLGDEVMVFNDMGYFGGNRDDGSVPSLLQFIEQHFAEAKPEAVAKP